jgi:hypothetical protein
MFNAGQNIALQDLWRRYEAWARCPSCGSEQVGYADASYAKLAEYNRTRPRRKLWESKRAHKRRVEAWSNSPGGPRYALRKAQEELAAAHEQTAGARAELAERYRRASPAERAKIDEIYTKRGVPSPYRDIT